MREDVGEPQEERRIGSNRALLPDILGAVIVAPQIGTGFFERPQFGWRFEWALERLEIGQRLGWFWRLEIENGEGLQRALRPRRVRFN